MKSNGFKWVFTCAVFVLAAVSTAAAQTKVTDQHIADLIREAALRSGVQQTTAPPSAPLVSGQSGDRPTVRLSLDDSIKLALDRNLDLSVQRLNPQTFDFSLASLRAIYKPTLASTISQQSQTTPSTQTISGGVVGTASPRTPRRITAASHRASRGGGVYRDAQ
jgi:hypothetical protein